MLLDVSTKNKTILTVTEEDEQLRVHLEGRRTDVFQTVEVLVECLHYHDIQKGDCIIDSMKNIQCNMQSAIQRGFEKAQDRSREEKKDERKY